MSKVRCPGCEAEVTPIPQSLDALGKKRRYVIPPHHAPIKNPTRASRTQMCEGAGKIVAGYKPPLHLIGQ